MSDSPDQHVDQLDDAVSALERGDWRTAKLRLFEGGDAGPDREVVDVVFCLRCVTRGMRTLSTVGNAEAAWHQFETARRRLADGAFLQLDVEPPHHLARTWLRWRTARLVWREQDDLTAVRLIFEDLPKGTQELIYATVEYLTWVEFDPFTVRIHPQDQELTGLDDDEYTRWRVGNRRDICARATLLRLFANVREGTVNERTWGRRGGYPFLREQALHVLATESVTRGRTDFPVRLGRQQAWDYARDLFECAPA